MHGNLFENILKRFFKFAFRVLLVSSGIFLLVWNLYTPDTLYRKVERQLWQAPEYVRKDWSVLDIQNTAQEIQRVQEFPSSLSPDDPFKILSHESGWYKYARNKNSNGTVDQGVSQQNSRYAPERCWKIRNRECNQSQILEIDVNLRMFADYLIWCATAFSDRKAIITCYNLPTDACFFESSAPFCETVDWEGKESGYYKLVNEMHVY